MNETQITDAHMDQVRGLPGGFIGQLLPFVVLFAGCWALNQQWHAVPDPYIVHWNGSWQPDGWAGKSFPKALLPAFLGLGMCVLMLLLQVFLHCRAAASGVRDEPTRRFAQLLRVRASNEVLLASEWLMAVVFALVTVGIPLAQTSRSAKLFVIAILCLSIGGGLLLTIWSVVRIHRRMAIVRELGMDWDSTADEHWKWGVIYSNPDDQRLLVENRMGMGFTFNMARPVARLAVALMLGLPVLLIGILLAL